MFAHLHVHSDYSFLDGLMSPKMLVSKAKSVGCEALSLTDHGEISGHIALHDAAAEAGIKPIYGTEAYQAPVSRFDKSPGEHRGHLTLLAMDGRGVHDLWTMSSLSYTDGFYYRPRVDWELLSLYGKRLWVGSACLASFISQAAMIDDRTTAKNVADLYRSIVGERFYIEIHTNSMPEQKQVNAWLVDFAEKEGIPFTFASDVHYCDKSDSDVHDALLGVQYKKKFSDADRPHNVPDYYLMSEDEVRGALSYLGGRIVDVAISNTSMIAESIEPFELDTSLKIPVGFVPDSFAPRGIIDGMTARDEYLVYLCMEGREKRLKGMDARDEYDERLVREMDFIIRHGLSDYMLTVARYTRWAKERMLVGPGRGSAAGSLVSYFLEITEIDPIRAGLLFERFLNEGRLDSLPDIDLDFPTHLRHRIKEVLVEWYGDDRVVSIGTVNRMGAKQSLKDAATYLGVDFTDAQRISDVIDTVPNIIELESKKGGGDRREIWDEIVSLIPDRETFASMRAERPRLFEIAEKFYGVARQSSEHAAGVIVSSVPVSTYLPVRVKKGEVVTQFDMHAVERLGFLKADILGLRTLETLQKARDLVSERRGEYVDFYAFGDEENTDGAVWDMLGNGDTLGVFQAETPGITGVLKKMKPRSIADLSAAIALYRPGILRAEYKDGRNMLDEYLLRGSGEIPASYLHPSLEPILKETHGIIVYQEQVMKICTDLAGYSPVEADNMRSIIGKKKKDKMEEEERKFIPALVDNGMPENVAKMLYENIKEFGSYGFNQAHSYSYAVVSFWCAYMKSKHPVEFMAALMDTDPKNIDGYIAECEKLGIRVQPPHVNHSGVTFTISGDDEIRFGLLGVKWLGESAADSIMRNAPYSSVEDFLEKNPARLVNKRNIESLMSLCAFSGLSLGGRSIEPSELLRRFVGSGKKVKGKDGETFWSVPSSLDDDVDNTPFTFHELRKKEMEYLGFCFSVYGFAEFEGRLERGGISLDKGSDIERGAYGRTYRCLCRVVSINKKTTKKKNRMAVVRVVTNDYIDFDIVLFPREWERYSCHFSVGEVVLMDIEKQRNEEYNEDSFVAVHVMKGTSDEW